MADELDELRWKVATACRILGMHGLVHESTGHVSARIPGTDEMFVRCRGGDERGLLFTDVDNVRRVDAGTRLRPLVFQDRRTREMNQSLGATSTSCLVRPRRISSK